MMKGVFSISYQVKQIIFLVTIKAFKVQKDQFLDSFLSNVLNVNKMTNVVYAGMMNTDNDSEQLATKFINS